MLFGRGYKPDKCWWRDMGPLEGLRVLELGNMIAAPTAGCMLADFGAEVVKVEHPQHGDDLRRWPPLKDGVSLWWKVTNRNKKLITIDLSRREGQALCRSMIPRFDVLLENFRPGTLEQWGLGYEQLAALQPGLVMVRISGYGQTGPYSRRPGYGTVAEAMSGMPSFTGFPDMPPTLSAFPLVDAISGVFAAEAAVMAIYERDHGGSGKGQVVDVSLFESMFRLIDNQVIAYDQLGLVKPRLGNRMEEDSPRNVYRTLDGDYVAISAGSQKTFARLADAIERPELNDDERFSTTENRCRNAEVLDSILVSWFAGRTLASAMATLQANDVVAGPVLDIRQIFCDPQYAAREDIIAVEDEELGTIRMQAPLPKFSRTPGGVLSAGGRLGEASESYLRTELGLGADEWSSLHSSGVV
jgi:crotonobetainyl-CoA:carnitine CoA-transferase CaiB-like acyl-CoA transferase